MRVGLEVLRLRLFPPRHAGWHISRQRIKKWLQNLLKNYVNRAHPPRMCPVMIINNALWLIIRGRRRRRGVLWKAIGNSPAPLLFKRSLFNQLAPDLLGTLVSLSAPTQWVDPYGKKGWVFQTPFRYGLTPSVSQVTVYLDYRGMSAAATLEFNLSHWSSSAGRFPPL